MERLSKNVYLFLRYRNFLGNIRAFRQIFWGYVTENCRSLKFNKWHFCRKTPVKGNKIQKLVDTNTDQP